MAHETLPTKSVKPAQAIVQFDEKHPTPPPPRGLRERCWGLMRHWHPAAVILRRGLTPSHFGLRLPIFRLRHYTPRPLRLPPSYGLAEPLHGGPTVSIVTPSFNQAQYLPRTIESVLSQNYPRLDYAVRDGGSSDDSSEILARYGDRLRWHSAPDGGQADAINQGLNASGGEIMAWLNSDDLLLPGTVSVVARFFAENPKVDVIYGHRILIDEEGRDIGRWILPPHEDHSQRWVDTIPQETMFWRRSLWERVGGLDANLQFAMDWDLILRFLEAGARFQRLPRFLGAFRVHQAQKTSARAADLGKPEIRSLRLRTLGQDPANTLIARQISGYLARHLVLHTGYRLGMVRY